MIYYLIYTTVLIATFYILANAVIFAMSLILDLCEDLYDRLKGRT